MLRLDAAAREARANLKAIIWTTILVAFVYVAVMVLPILINEYQFQDSIQEIAQFASINHASSEKVQKTVLEEAQKEDLPIEAEDIKVQSQAGNIHIYCRLFGDCGPEGV